MADRISKLDAARRQIETAIELYFGGGDALPVYTLAYAAFKVLFDLYPHKSADGFSKQLDGVIKAEGWKSMAAPANFLKHADRDPDALLDEQHPDRGLALIGLATVLYRRLAGDLTRKMMAFDCWVEWLDEEALNIPEVDRNAERAAAICERNFQDRRKPTVHKHTCHTARQSSGHVWARKRRRFIHMHILSPGQPDLQR